MSFKDFSDKQQQYVAELLKGHEAIFTVNVDNDTLWQAYLDSFPPGTNEIFRERREHDCSCCRHFIKSVGNILVLKDGKLSSIWDFETGSDIYQPVVDALDELVSGAQINGVFAAKQANVGTAVSREMRDDGQVISWHHFYLKLPQGVVTDDLGKWHDGHNTNRAVFQSSLEQISAEAVDTALDLISQNSLYRGQESAGALQLFLKLKREYDTLPTDKRNNFCWIKSRSYGPAISRMKNTAIGTFLLDVSSGEDLEVALRKYEAPCVNTKLSWPHLITSGRKLSLRPR